MQIILNSFVFDSQPHISISGYSCLLKSHAGMCRVQILVNKPRSTDNKRDLSCFELNTQTIHISTKAIACESFLIKVQIVTVKN